MLASSIGGSFSAVKTSLLCLKSVFNRGKPQENSAQFLQDMIVGADFGWNQDRPITTSYQEALSSEEFGLIRNADMRSEISRYNVEFTQLRDRADAREIRFPHLSYRLVPRNSESSNRRFLLGTEQGLSPEETERLIDGALESPLKDYVIAELNLARFPLHLSSVIHQQYEAPKIKLELTGPRISPEWFSACL